MLLLTLGLVLALACWWLFQQAYSWPMNETEVPGTYRQEWPWGVETLTLEPGGTFREEFQYTSGESIADSGKWGMSTALDGDVIVRVDGAVVWPDFRGPQYGPGKLTFTFRARQSSRGKVLEREHDPDGAVRLVRIQCEPDEATACSWRGHSSPAGISACEVNRTVGRGFDNPRRPRVSEPSGPQGLLVQH